MRHHSFLLFFAFASSVLSAQEVPRFEVKAGKLPAEVLPQQALYILPVFTRGTVVMRDATFSVQQLNYNYFLDEMQFLGSAGDTLTIAEPVLLRSVFIDSLTFYYAKGYLQKVAEHDSIILAVKHSLLQFADKTHSGYGISTASSSITTYGSIISSSANYKLQVRKDVYFEKADTYFLGDRFAYFVKADRKGFITFFPAKKDALLDYVKTKKLRFTNAADIEKIFQFCSQP